MNRHVEIDIQAASDRNEICATILEPLKPGIDRTTSL